MIKKSVQVLAAFFLVFGVGISSSALAKEIMSPEIREAILALRYKNLSAAKKLVRKVEQQLSYSPGGPADRTLAQLYFVRCSLWQEENADSKADYQEPIKLIEMAMIKDPYCLAFREKFVELNALRFPTQAQILEEFDRFGEEADAPHAKLKNLYKGIYFSQLGKNATAPEKHRLYQEALRYANFALRDRATDEVKTFYLKSFVTFYEWSPEQEIDPDDYDQFIGTLRGISNSSGDDYFLAAAAAQRFLNAFPEALKYLSYIKNTYLFGSQYVLEYYKFCPDNDKKFTLLSEGIQTNPLDPTLWELMFLFLDESYNIRKLDHYKKGIDELMGLLKKKGLEDSSYVRAFEGILLIYQKRYEDAEKRFRRIEDLKVNDNYLLDDYLLRIYVNSKKVDRAIKILKRGNITLHQMFKIGPDLSLCDFLYEAAILACQERNPIHLDYLREAETNCPRIYRDLKYDIDKINFLEDIIRDRRIDAIERKDSVNSRRIQVAEQKIRAMDEDFRKKVADLVIRINDLDNKTDRRLNELAARIEKNQRETLEKIEKLKNDLTRLIRSVEDGLKQEIDRQKLENLKAQTALLRLILENRADIANLKKKLRPKLSDYLNISLGLNIGVAEISINLIRVLDDLIDIFA